MPRPCGHNDVLLAPGPYQDGQCRQCWLYANDGRYRKMWDDLPTRPPEACPHLWKRVRDEAGEEVKRECPTCGGKKVMLDVFECRCPARRQPGGANDQVTLKDCQTCLYRPKPMINPRALILTNRLSPGDVLVMTAAVHSLHKAHPGKYLIGVDTSCPAIWEHNPDLATPEKLVNAEVTMMHYPLIDQCNQRPVHVLQGYVDFLAHALQVPITLAVNRPLIYLSEEEKGWMNQVHEWTGRTQKFWLLNAGNKKDYTAKYYPWYQEVVDRLQSRITFVQVGKLEHVHKPLRGVINLLGKTDDRQLIRLCHHAQGVLCGVTFTMHLAAAFSKPAVIVAGSREPRAWNCYPKQILLNNVGLLPCSLNGSCWKSRVVRLGDGAEQDQSLCENPVLTEQPSAKCMAMITPEAVCSAIESYYIGGVLSY